MNRAHRDIYDHERIKPSDQRPLAFRAPVLVQLGELLLVFAGASPIALAMHLLYAPGVALLVLLIAAGLCLVRLRHHWRGPVLIQGQTLILRAGFLWVREARVPLAYASVWFRPNLLTPLTRWQSVEAAYDGWAVRVGLIADAETLQWVLEREYRYWEAAARQLAVYGPGRSGFSLLPHGDDER